ncbi:TldD/PmbA family protein [filamentous cyanobacterium LEGE 11480]|uniref:TldD/PmbA family protein n=1 Tax=Romeriopsis navalis LEGE 11480 TaxID=2777977 RepID=A0A928Z6L8_9CYAN|nr:TldD/PmbA family protein [Romeriopsis navalis]MBE9032345.1 TldD/PmbA family protein [Romeriopsis navalis LEGE 11480]
MPSSPEQFLELALKSGAEDAEVFQSTSTSSPISFEANRLKQVESIEADGIAVRLWRNGQPGIAVAYGEVEPQALVDRALAISDLNPAEDIELGTTQHPQYPTDGSTLSVDQLVEQGRSAIAKIRDRYPEVLCGGGWDCETETTRLLNSKGLDCHYEDITLSSYLEVEWVRGEDFLNVSDGDMNRDRLNEAAFIQRILQHLEWCHENTDAPDGRVPVLLTAKAADLLWGTIYNALNGKQVLEKSSPWSDRQGQAVMSESLTLHQDPTSGPFSCPFDDEGSITQPLMLVEAGQLTNFYTDRRTGKLLGQATTGNGFRSDLGSYPTPRLCNLLVEPGQQSFEQLVASIDDGLILDQVLGGGPGIAGDFSVNVDLGYRVKQGKIVGRVKDTMVAGNCYQTLKNPVVLGNDADWSGSCHTPSVIVEGLSVTGRSPE